jgi:hypothetical protein
MFITPTLSSKNFPQIGDNLTYNCMAQKYFTFDRGQTSVNITCLTNNAYSGPIGKELVPHSQCSLRENPKFLQNFRSKNKTLKANF